MTAYRETTITVFGVTRVVRTEQTGTVEQLERDHTRAVKTAAEELRSLGLKDAVRRAEQAVADAEQAAKGRTKASLQYLALKDARAHLRGIQRKGRFAIPESAYEKALRKPKITYYRKLPEHLREYLDKA